MSEIIDRYHKMLELEGFSESKVSTGSKDGLGDFESYFDYLLDCKLGDTSPLDAEKTWESMKRQINYRDRQTIKLNEDYMKLQNKIRHLEADLEEMRRERKY